MSDLQIALMELERSGIAFTTEVDADGQEIYVVDSSIRLTGKDLIYLNRHRSLTLVGMRSYLSGVTYPNCFG